jgi:ABC-type Zn uptake system ZnuABC Zn-binding protein ZnuA
METDPHSWGNVQYAISEVAMIAYGLSAVDPANTAYYTANAAAYTLKLQDLDAWAEAQIATLPADRRALFSNHDALGYLARRYGLTVSGSVIDSFSTVAQPSAQHFAQVVQALRASGARVIFIESIANPALAEQVARAAGAKVAPELFTDALGELDSAAPTYIDQITYNVSTIRRGAGVVVERRSLGCDAIASGALTRFGTWARLSHFWIPGIIPDGAGCTLQRPDRVAATTRPREGPPAAIAENRG